MLSPVQRLANINAVTHLVDDTYAVAHDNKLILWQSAVRGGLHGRNAARQHEPVLTLPDAIQRVCYYESAKLDWEPKLLVVTAKQILLCNFALTGDKDLGQTAVKRRLYDLQLVEESEFAPIDLELGEEVSWIGYSSKTDRIFFASHTADYNQVYVKELVITDSAREVRTQRFRPQRTLIEDSMQFVKKKVLDARSLLVANQKLTVHRAQDQHNIAVQLARNIVPHWMNFTVVRKVIVAVTVDEDRNLMYVLVNRLTREMNKDTRQPVGLFDATEVEVYDCGILGDRFKRVVTIT